MLIYIVCLVQILFKLSGSHYTYVYKHALTRDLIFRITQDKRNQREKQILQAKKWRMRSIKKGRREWYDAIKMFPDLGFFTWNLCTTRATELGLVDFDPFFFRRLVLGTETTFAPHFSVAFGPNLLFPALPSTASNLLVPFRTKLLLAGLPSSATYLMVPFCP